MLLTDPFNVVHLATLAPTLMKLLAAIAISALAYLVLFRPLDRVKVGTFFVLINGRHFAGGKYRPSQIVETFWLFHQIASADVWALRCGRT